MHDLAARPAGAVTVDRQPAKLAISAMGVPGTGSLIDVVSFWSVPMSQHDSDAWISAHAPAGMNSELSSSGVGGPAPADIVTGRAFNTPNGPAWTQATLQESVAVVDTHHSVWRIEGEAIWLDPSPIRVKMTGPMMRVTVRGRCPATDRNMVGVSNSGTPLDTALLPDGLPTAALVCRYAGANQGAFSLLQSSAMSSATVGELVTRVRAIPLAHEAAASPRSCPMDDWGAAVTAFSFPGRPDVDLWVRTTGCATISNGWIRTAGNPLS